MKTKTPTAAKTTKTQNIKKAEKMMKAAVAKHAEGKKPRITREPKTTLTYTGAPMEALKVFSRSMPEFKNCEASCFLLVGEKTYSFANVYNGNLKASYDPKHYTYQLTEKAQKKLAKKIEAEGFEEQDVTEWPTWIVNAAGKTRKSK